MGGRSAALTPDDIVSRRRAKYFMRGIFLDDLLAVQASIIRELGFGLSRGSLIPIVVIPVVVVVMMMPVPAMPIILIRVPIMAVVRVILPVIVGPGMLISWVHVNSKVVCF
jgi:hypothetical protein